MYTSSILTKELHGPGKRKISKTGVCLNFFSFLWIMTNTFIGTTLFMKMGLSCLSKHQAFSQNDARGGFFFSFYSSLSTHSVKADIPKYVLGHM